jgi:DMSO reductase anchor subunit
VKPIHNSQETYPGVSQEALYFFVVAMFDYSKHLLTSQKLKVMLQRKQTLWLLLSLITAILSFKFPFLTGTKIINAVPTAGTELFASSNFLLLILTWGLALLAGITIFLYKDRKLQSWLCILGILMAIGVIIIYILQREKFETSTLALFSILPFLTLTGFILAYQGVRKDEKLVKSLDKLR